MTDAASSSGLSEPIRTAIAAVADRLEEHRVGYAVGGSLLLRLRGFHVPVGDIDLVTAAERDRVTAALAGWEPTVRDGRSFPWESAWFATAEWPGEGTPVGVDVIGGPAIVIDGRRATVPTSPSRTAIVDGRRVPLGDLGVWHHIYRVIEPAKAALIAATVPEAQLAAAAARMGLAAA